MTEYVVIYEAPAPSTGVRGGWNGRDHQYISHADDAEHAVRQVIESNPHWADGSLWAVEARLLTKVNVTKRYEFATN